MAAFRPGSCWKPASLSLVVLFCLTWMTGCASPLTAPVPSPSPAATLTAIPPATPSPPPTPQVTPTPTPEPTACAQQTGWTESLAASSSRMNDLLSARIHLPPCYDPSGKTRYPVLYLLHGQSFQSDQWERLGAFRAADHLFAGGQQPFLIVLPNESDSYANPYESSFGDALTGALVAQVDKSYPTCPERGCRAIGGLSRGASWAVYLGLKNWGQFAIIGAHSFPPFYNLDTRLPELLKSIPPGQFPRLYLDIGASDPYLAPASAFEILLTQDGVAHEWYLNEGGHDETYWAAHTPAYITWYARQFAP